MGFLPSWVSVWLTPIWLLSFGVLMGLAGLLLLAVLAAGLSRVPGLGTLWERKKQTKLCATIVALLVGVGWLAWRVTSLQALAPFNPEFSWQANIVDFITSTGIVVVLSWLSCYATIAMLHRRNVREIPLALSEGVLKPISVVLVFVAGFGIVGGFISQNPTQLLQSTADLLTTGGTQSIFTLPAGDSEPLPLPVQFRTDQLISVSVVSTEDTIFSFEPSLPLDTGVTLELSAGKTQAVAGSAAFGIDVNRDDVRTIEKVFALNQGEQDALLKIVVQTGPRYREVAWIPWITATVMFLYLFYFAQRSVAPRVSAIALAATKSDIAQPLFAVLIGLGSFLFLVFLLLPYSTFGEDIKLLKITGLTLMRVFAMVQAVWAASTSIADEIEGRTALTVLSKPLQRRDFILGKYLGIAWTVILMFTIFTVVLLTVISYKPLYDAREGAYKVTYNNQAKDEVDPTWENCFFETTQVLPGVAMALMESLVIAAVSVAISTRLPMLANFMIFLAVYLLGHLTPLIVKSSVGEFAPVRFFGQLLSTAFPNLELFNPEVAVTTSKIIPVEYLAWLSLYFILYVFLALLLALVLFEDRDVS